MDVSRIQGSEAQVEGQKRPVAPTEGAAHQNSFETVLRTQVGYGPSLRFSAHAQQRIQGGGMSLDGESLARLERAVNAAGQKGARDALVLMDDLALLVSINNRTVITAVDQARQKTGVFTNIDSVVMA